MSDLLHFIWQEIAPPNQSAVLPAGQFGNYGSMRLTFYQPIIRPAFGDDMLPGPFEAPIIPLPTYIPPLIMWLLILGAAVGIAIALFRVFVVEPDERVSAFLVFLLALVVVILAYLILMNGPQIIFWIQRQFRR